MATIRDVAQRANVSISTVSRVINDSKNVSPQLRLQVEQAVRELGFTTNRLARGLKSSRSKSIAVILTAFSRTFFTDVLDGISKRAAQHGYSVLISETNDSMETEEQLVRYYASQWVDGIILDSVAFFGDDEKVCRHCAMLSRLEKNGRPIPVVTLEYPCPDPQVDSVVIDHAAAAKAATSHLLDTGKSRILHITAPLNSYFGKERLAGYVAALNQRGLVRSDNLIYEGDFSSASGYRAVDALLRRGTRFDGIFAANDQMALGALMACKEHGLRVPEDVAIMGSDNIFVTAVVSPSLSSVDVPRYQMGTSAMDLLHENICIGRRKLRRTLITLDTKLVLRASTVPGKQPDWEEFKSLHW